MFGVIAPRGDRLRRVLIGLAIILATGCDDTNPVRPSGATPISPTGPTVALHGRVTDSQERPISGALIEGLLTDRTIHFGVLTDANGRYETPQVSGTVTLAVSKDGFVDQSRTVTVTEEDINFTLELSSYVERINPYTLTFTASPSCALPADAMMRRYTAEVIEYKDGTLMVKLSGAEFVAWGEDAGFTGVRDGSAVRFSLVDDVFAMSVVELIASNTELALTGTAVGEMNEARIAATLSGVATVRTWSGHFPLATCEASDHRLEFTR